MPSDINLAEVLARLADGAIILDAQGPGRFEAAHIPGAIRGSIDDADAVLAHIGDDLDRPIVVYCTDRSCTGSTTAMELLEAAGYRKVARYPDGLAGWLEQHPDHCE